MSYQQIIYNRLRQHGISEAGALGILGNWECESGNEPYRMQGDFSAYRTLSKAYVQALTNGSKTKAQFQNDAVGFGLAQWTYHSRKAEMYDEWKKSGKAIDDAEFQVDFAVKETKRDYPALWDFLCQTTDVFTATSRFCREWERPAVNNIDARFAAAKRIQNEIDLAAWQDGSEPEPTPTPQPQPEPITDKGLQFRTIDYHCSGWREVYIMQGILQARGYYIVLIDGEWDDEEENAIRLFQKEHGLTVDGIVGQKTWDKLLERG